MIDQLIGHITDEVIAVILDLIRKRYYDFQRFTESEDFQSLFRDEYAPHNKQHSLSWAISSAFPSEEVVADSLKVCRLVYGGGHTRPILYNEKIELMILNEKTDFQAAYLKRRYAYNCDNFSKEKLFAYLLVESGNKRMNAVSLLLPSETGDIVASESLFTQDSILKFSA